MKKITLLLVILISVSSLSYAQIYVDKDGNVYDQRRTTPTRQQPQPRVVTAKKSGSGFDMSKLTVGGNFGLQFGDYTIVNISPQVGYKFSKYFTLGTGIGYTYYKEDYRNSEYKRHYATFNLYARLFPIEYIVIGVQPEVSRMWQSQTYYNETYKNNEFVPTMLVGGGLRLGGMLAMIQYDLVQDKNSPYGDGIVYTVGYSFDF